MSNFSPISVPSTVTFPVFRHQLEIYFIFKRKNRNVAKISILGDRYVIVEFFLVEERQEINKGADLNVNTRSSKRGGGRIRCQGVEWMHRYADLKKNKKNKMIAERAGRIAQKWRSRWAELSPDRNEKYTIRPAVSRRPARS